MQTSDNIISLCILSNPSTFSFLVIQSVLCSITYALHIQNIVDKLNNDNN